MFTDSQKAIYESCRDRILAKLDLEISPFIEQMQHKHSTMNESDKQYNVFIFLVLRSLKASPDTMPQLCKTVYATGCEQKELLFKQLSSLCQGELHEHYLVEEVTDPRFISGSTYSKDELIDHFALLLNNDIGQWYHKTNAKNPINRMFMNLLAYRTNELLTTSSESSALTNEDHKPNLTTNRP